MVMSWQCGEQTPRMKGPCVLWKDHYSAVNPSLSAHRSAGGPVNEETPRLRQFARIVNAGLDHGVQLSYVEIAELMGHPNLRSVRNYGLGSRYTKLRQKIFRERGVVPDNHRRSLQQSIVVVQSMQEVMRRWFST